jgi:predicted small lipoprotein YifL
MLGRNYVKTIRVLMLLFALSLVSACGQKGKLTLPDEQQLSIVPFILSTTLFV